MKQAVERFLSFNSLIGMIWIAQGMKSFYKQLSEQWM